MNLEKLLEKLGAKPLYPASEDPEKRKQVMAWKLWRLDTVVDEPIAEWKRREWLLIGETTEALREKGCICFESHFFSDGQIRLVVTSGGDFNYEYFSDSLLDCYRQAGEELL